MSIAKFAFQAEDMQHNNQASHVFKDILNSATIPVSQFFHQLIPLSPVTCAMRGLYVFSYMGSIFSQWDYVVKFQLLIRKYLFFAYVAPSTILFKNKIVVDFSDSRAFFNGIPTHILFFGLAFMSYIVSSGRSLFYFWVSCTINVRTCQVIFSPLSVGCITFSGFSSSVLTVFYIALMIRCSRHIAIFCSAACAFILNVGGVFCTLSFVHALFAVVIMPISKTFVCTETFNRLLCRRIAEYADFRQNEQGELDNVIYFIHGKSNLSYRHAPGCFSIAGVNYLPLLIIPRNPPQKPLYSTSIAELALLANKGYQA